MPTIRLPDGRTIKVPDDASDAEIDQIANEIFAQAAGSGQPGAAQPQTREQMVAEGIESGGDFGNYARRFLQGGTAAIGLPGIADEALAGLSATAYPVAEAVGLVPEWDAGWQDRYDAALEIERGRLKKTEGLGGGAAEVGGALVAAMTPIGRLGGAIGNPLTAANMARGVAAGTGLGASYGFNTGEGGVENRLENVPVNAAIGAAGGAAGNVLQAGAGRMLADPNKVRAQQMGVLPETYRIARSAAEMADVDVPGGGQAFIRQGGPDAMIGDVMPGKLNTYANVGAGAPIARGNLNARVDRASQNVTRAMDDTLGQPQGIRQTARDIASSTRQARQEGYEAAYSKPIDYAAETGQRIEGILRRVPARTLREAVDEANEAMTAAGVINKQILIDIADDGAVTFREMPNVQQLDEIKKALQTIGRENVDQFGRPTARGNRANALARDLREALGEAVPEYNAATAAGADKIAQDQALDFGRKLLSPSITKEMADEFGKTLSQAEKARVAEGVRFQLDEALGNMRMARNNPSLDTREAWSAIQRIMTRNNQEKLRSVLGREQADTLFGELEQATRAFTVRGRAAPGSDTAGRTADMRELTSEVNRGRLPDRTVASIWEAVGSLPARGLNAMTGRTQGQIMSREQTVQRELAELITGLRGEDAIRAFQQLLSQQRPPVNYQGPFSRRLAASSRLAAPPAVAPLLQP